MSVDREAEDPVVLQEAVLQEALRGFVRAFGLHQPESTPCGQPIPVSEAHALGELARSGELRQVELARRLRLQKSTVSRLVGQLTDRGWVERGPARDDGRGVVLRLSPAGQRVAHNLAEARREKFSRLLTSIPAHERPGVLHALRVLTEALDE
ncbi:MULTISPECIES: MarR family winged helix-turn-helix transcriptional regulator [Streptomyces]|uniref:MarR family transcriptional regulator n=2 Tax=Streptomyces TaxID=1883 RepID=A0A3R7HL10_9ACTN|nr:MULTISPECIES: MarR family transcriptional regulator [Streptomyces]KNE82118.1 MarR family transcriptional regulator [Streptomyces fradiae]OFA56507.1 MarR family transcriptional regulator [Streptomyces fradiae]PQM22773.1 MarR family transcriptional regulator [Streptomyces xinghaiensis]RKM97942.1 MarR family transcriptional regulator [Streptomyces xinghaiensis]RNC73921.1 MarR family transcriptional regulator [Streptomyces xinghaiensis]